MNNVIVIIFEDAKGSGPFAIINLYGNNLNVEENAHYHLGVLLTNIFILKKASISSKMK